MAALDAGRRQFLRAGFGRQKQFLEISPRHPLIRRHSSIDTRMAVSTPRFVTSCGPSETLDSSISLNRAFAS